MGPRTGPDGCGNFRPHRHSFPRLSSPLRVAITTELFRPSSSGVIFNVTQSEVLGHPSITIQDLSSTCVMNIHVNYVCSFVSFSLSTVFLENI